jgi:hypothetical protein
VQAAALAKRHPEGKQRKRGAGVPHRAAAGAQLPHGAAGAPAVGKHAHQRGQRGQRGSSAQHARRRCGVMRKPHAHPRHGGRDHGRSAGWGRRRRRRHTRPAASAAPRRRCGDVAVDGQRRRVMMALLRAPAVTQLVLAGRRGGRRRHGVRAAAHARRACGWHVRAGVGCAGQSKVRYTRALTRRPRARTTCQVSRASTPPSCPQLFS